MVTYLGGSILITIFALGGSIVSYNLQTGFNFSVHKLTLELVQSLKIKLIILSAELYCSAVTMLRGMPINS